MSTKETLDYKTIKSPEPSLCYYKELPGTTSWKT